MNVSNRERCAIHEAAHAQLHLHLGHTVQVELDPDGQGGRCVKLSGPDIKPGFNGEVDLAALGYAGIVGERLAFGVATEGPSATDLNAVEAGIYAGRITAAEAAGFRALAADYAERILRANWSDVETLAARLLQVGVVRIRPDGQPVALEAKPALQVRREMLPLMTRSAVMRAASGDTYEVVFSTGAAVIRVDSYGERYSEELVMTSKAVDLSRLNAGAPLLASHDASSLQSIIGVVSNARLENGVGLARIRLSQRPEVQGVVGDVRDGILKHVSVGYKVLSAERIQRAGDLPTLRITSWQPCELSLVAIPADAEARIKSNAPRFEATVAA